MEWVAVVILVPVIIAAAQVQGYLSNPFLLPSSVLLLALLVLHLFLTSKVGIRLGLAVKERIGVAPMALVLVVGFGSLVGGLLFWGWWAAVGMSKDHLALLGAAATAAATAPADGHTKETQPQPTLLSRLPRTPLTPPENRLRRHFLRARAFATTSWPRVSRTRPSFDRANEGSSGSICGSPKGEADG
jgi:hypothetical protein